MIRVLVVAVVLLSGCARWDRDPLDVLTADPAALQMPVTTFVVFPF